MASTLAAPHSSTLLAHLQSVVQHSPTNLEPDFSHQHQTVEEIKTETEETVEDARLEVIVTNPRCAAQMQHVGITIMYYCTKCGHNSDQLLRVTEHLELGCEAEGGVDDATIREAAQSLTQQKWNSDHEPVDHDYLEHPHNEGTSPEEIDEDSLPSQEKSSDTDPRKWYCKWCPYTPLYSKVDLEQHTKCHGTSGRDILTCYACLAGVGPSSNDWHRVRSHLFYFHKVHFQLLCEHCEAIFRGHTDYNKHVSSHKHSCGWDFCKYSSLSARDVIAHEKCHTGSDGRMFCCYICKYQNKQLSGKWGIMHAHLVSKHTGVIGARYSCSACAKGFQELRKYQQHLPCKLAGKPQCDRTVTEQNLHAEREDTMQLQEKGDVNGGMYGNIPTVRKSLRLVQKVKEEVNQEGREDRLYLSTDIKTDPDVSPLDNSRSTAASVGSVTVMADPTDDDILVSKDTEGVTADTTEDTGTITTETQNTPSTDKTQHRCYHCYKKFATDGRLQRHVLHQHSEQKMQRVPCAVCGKDFRNQMQMRNHKREVHEGMKRSRTSRPKHQKWFVCETCGYTTPEASRLRNHKLSTHEGLLPYKCPHCQYCTNEKSDLYRHRWKHRPVKRYQCPQCSYATNTRWVLVNHCSKQHGIELPRLHRNTLGTTQGSKHLTKHLQKQWSVDSQLLNVIGDGQLQEINVQDLGVHTELSAGVRTGVHTSVETDVQPHIVAVGTHPGAQFGVQSDGQTNIELDVQNGVPTNIHTVVQQSENSSEAVLSDNVRVVYLQADQIEQAPLALITVLSEEATQ